MDRVVSVRTGIVAVTMISLPDSEMSPFFDVFGEVTVRSLAEPDRERSRCMRCLLDSLQYHLSRATAGRSSRPPQFYIREIELTFSN